MDGMCLTPACATGEMHCQDEWLQICKADRTGFMNQTQCASAALCDDKNKECDECMPQALECKMDVLRTCDDTGHWGAPQDCAATGGTCDASTGCVPSP
jgi:hypothetical protein